MKYSKMDWGTMEAVVNKLGGMEGVERFLRDEMEVIFKNQIIRHAIVNRTRTPQGALDATGRKQYTDTDVVAEMPQGDGDETDVVFFKLGRYISDDDLEKEYEMRGLMPADPYALSAVNEADPAFADEHPNCTHWKDKDGKWCYAAFDRWVDDRNVHVDRLGHGWDDRWWFAGRRK